MLDASHISGCGFTIICSDNSLLYEAEPQSQENINAMFEKIHEVLKEYNFDIAIVAQNEDAMRLQARLMFNEMYRQLDRSVVAQMESSI
jgi:hypothetical protein